MNNIYGGGKRIRWNETSGGSPSVLFRNLGGGDEFSSASKEETSVEFHR